MLRAGSAAPHRTEQRPRPLRRSPSGRCGSDRPSTRPHRALADSDTPASRRSGALQLPGSAIRPAYTPRPVPGTAGRPGSGAPPGTAVTRQGRARPSRSARNQWGSTDRARAERSRRARPAVRAARPGGPAKRSIGGNTHTPRVVAVVVKTWSQNSFCTSRRRSIRTLPRVSSGRGVRCVRS